MMRSTLLIIIAMVLLPSVAMAEPSRIPAGRAAEVQRAVLSYVQQRTADIGCETRIKRLTISGNPSFPAGTLDYEVVAPQQWEGWGRAGISVVVRKGTRVVGNLTVWVEVEALVDMVVTVRQINHGSVITTADLALRKQDIAAVQGRYLARTEDAVGKKARVTLRPNAAIRSDQLEKVPLIRAGQLVTIIAENERMRITATGKSKSAGAEGDTITVQNLGSLKELPARVLDSTTVLIVF
ncbi:SAF domain protein [Pelobacter propionicus DSM 2379]|uniref:Flagella basal body P-ring formation protein FlgA n=2 Tax=Pelobacter propionicus TaxID=29543 RepID=A1AUM2_PELPD|nr:SAF domain protein [Pelobacter propionicus DSM 2379]